MELKEKSKKTIDQAKEILDGYEIPITLRQLYYRFVARQYFPNLDREYRRLSRLCVIGRDLEMLPEEKFTDRLREIEIPPSWSGLEDYKFSVINSFKLSIWENQDVYLEIWSEKDALREVIGIVTREYQVPLLVARGQVGRTAIFQAWERFKMAHIYGKICHLTYFGDFDPSGLSIFNSLKERIKEKAPFVNFKRVALTPQQIVTYQLPQDPAKASDPNFKKFVKQYGDNVVELDALPPEVLQKLIKDTILKHLDMEKYWQTIFLEARLKAKIESVFDNL